MWPFTLPLGRPGPASTAASICSYWTTSADSCCAAGTAVAGPSRKSACRAEHGSWNREFDRVTAARVFIIRINDAEGQQSSRDYPRTLDGASQTYEDGGGRCTLRASSL